MKMTNCHSLRDIFLEVFVNVNVNVNVKSHGIAKKCYQ